MREQELRRSIPLQSDKRVQPKKKARQRSSNPDIVKLRPPLEQHLGVSHINLLLAIGGFPQRHQLCIRWYDSNHRKDDQTTRQSSRAKDELLALLPADAESLYKGALVVAYIGGERRCGQNDGSEQGQSGHSVAQLESAFPQRESLGNIEVDMERSGSNLGSLVIEEVCVDDERVG